MKVKFFGGSKHGEAIEISAYDHDIMVSYPQYGNVWSEGLSDPVKIVPVDYRTETYTKRKIQGPTKLHTFYALSTWSDDDILEFLFG